MFTGRLMLALLDLPPTAANAGWAARASHTGKAKLASVRRPSRRRRERKPISWLSSRLADNVASLFFMSLLLVIESIAESSVTSSGSSAETSRLAWTFLLCDPNACSRNLCAMTSVWSLAYMRPYSGVMGCEHCAANVVCNSTRLPHLLSGILENQSSLPGVSNSTLSTLHVVSGCGPCLCWMALSFLLCRVSI